MSTTEHTDKSTKLNTSNGFETKNNELKGYEKHLEDSSTIEGRDNTSQNIQENGQQSQHYSTTKKRKSK